jgi:hypothetical protein
MEAPQQGCNRVTYPILLAPKTLRITFTAIIPLA